MTPYVLAVQTVECSNCGGDVAWAALGIAIALIALVVSAVALRIARKQLEIDERQHSEFMRQITARAEFGIHIQAPAARDGVISTDATSTYVSVEIELRNSGARRAGPTVLNVFIPNLVTEARWSDAAGNPISGAQAPAPTLERLTDLDGKEWSCKFLSAELPHVTTRSPVHKFVVMNVHTAALGPGETLSVPLRVTAQADEIDEDEVSSAITLRLVGKDAVVRHSHN